MFSQLRGLLEVTRLVRTADGLPELLDSIARTIGASLGYGAVVVNLYRPAWDDFVVSTVFGSDAAREALLGRARAFADWEPLLDLRFLRRGAYLVPAGHYDWSEDNGASFTPDLPASDNPDAWLADDALFVPLRGADGRLLGVLSVDEPASGCRPTEEEIDVLVAVSEHAALAVETALESARAHANRDALARLLDVSSRLTETRDTTRLLELVCAAISDALGFERVAVQLLDDGDGSHHTVATAGFAQGENVGAPLESVALDALLQPQFDVAGCFVLPHEEARALLPNRPAGYRSRRDGRGPHAWQNHWLFVPLHDRRRRRIGYVWVDDPVDRLVPDPERLQILRAFANLAATALDQAAQFDELQTAYERHRALIDASPVAIVDLDLEGRVRSWNTAAAETFGWTADEVLGRVSLIVPGDEADALHENIGRVVRGETIRDVDVRRVHRDGSSIDVSVSAAPIRDARGEIVGVASLMLDVTARKRSERALVASEGRKEAVLRAVLDCVVIVDDEGLIAEVNPATEETFGWTRADALGRPFLELAVAPESRAGLVEVFETGSGPLLGSRLEISALRSDHRRFPAEIAITRVVVPGPPLLAVSVRDVTRRRESEERLGRSEARYRALVEQLPVATYINEAGPSIRTSYISPQIESMLGFPVSDWLTEGFFQSRLHPEDRERVLAEVERTRKTSEEFRMDYRLLAADGRVVWVHDATVAVRDSEYRPLMLQGCFVDVTEEREREEALRLSEELYRLVVECSTDVIAVFDRGGAAQYVSPAAAGVIGRLPESLVGSHWPDLIHPDDVGRLTSYLDSRLGGVERAPAAARVRHAGGGWVTLEGSISVVRDGAGTPSRFVVVCRPVAQDAASAAA